VAPDGSWLTSGGRDGTVRVWDPASGRERATLTGHTRGVMALAVAPDGSWLATRGSGGTVQIWDPASGLALAFMRLDSRLDRPATLGRFALAVGSLAGLCVFDLLVATDSV
jgi:WD40 repeat protein